MTLGAEGAKKSILPKDNSPTNNPLAMVNQKWYILAMSNDEMQLRVYFYKTSSGKQPVRDWLRALPQPDKKVIGDDLKTAQL